MPHPGAHPFAPVTPGDWLAGSVLGTVFTSPLWYDSLKAISTVAALLVPVVTVAMGIAVLVEKWQVIRARGRHVQPIEAPNDLPD